MRQLTPVVEKILIINVIVFFANHLFGWDLIDLLGLRYIFSAQFKPYQFLTHLFVHAGFNHLFSNMFTLVTFGPILEYHLSSKRFLSLYLITGIGAALLYTFIFYLEIGSLESMYHSYLANPNPESFSAFLRKFPNIYNLFSNLGGFVHDFFRYPDNPAYLAKSKTILAQFYAFKMNIPIIGASGAIFGILTAFAMLFPNVRLSLLLLPIPIKAKYFIILYGMYELYAGIRVNPADNVAHFAHLGGILFAYLLVKWHQRKSNK